MKIHHRVLNVCLLGLALTAFGPAIQAQTPTSTASAQAEDPVTRLIEMSSLERTLRELPAFFRQGLEQAKSQGAPIAPQVLAALKGAAD